MVLVASRLWVLTVYRMPIDPKLELDVQWRWFVTMGFDPDRRQRIGDEANESFRVDVRSRTVTPVRR